MGGFRDVCGRVRRMNLYLKAMMDKPSIPRAPYCAVCGTTWPGVTEHHIVPRSQNPGWKKNPGPTIYVCGSGTTGCHGQAEHKRLHFRYRDGWQYLETEPMKYEHALELDGWVDC